MRFVRISQTELEKLKCLYESVMSHASHGLFYREGEILGREMIEMASGDPNTYLETAGRLIKGRGWVEEITFTDTRVFARGSFESLPGANEATCHRLRGMIHVIMEKHTGKKLLCLEDKCLSLGDTQCEFIMREMEGN
ncbi:MAG: V4R domain-containing protein [Thermoplasmata archaeon]|nr:V4R domain-containing protein [Thermoplasmata archaeon]